MAKITLNDLTTNYGSQALHNTNNASIETELNDKVLYRVNPTGEPNQMENALDMNSNQILNLSPGILNTDAVNYQQLTAAIAAAGSGLIAAQREVQTGADVVATVTTFTGITFTVAAGNLFVFLNGNYQTKDIDYTETSSSSITWLKTINSTDGITAITNLATTNSTTDTSAVTHVQGGTTYNLATYLQNRYVVYPGDAIQTALASNDRIILLAGTHNTSSTITLSDNQHIHLQSGASIVSTAETAVRITCQYSSLTGEGWSSVIQSTAVQNPKGIVLVGHPDQILDETKIFYNNLDNFRILGADSTGQAAASSGKYTVGLMFFNNGAFHPSKTGTTTSTSAGKLVDSGGGLSNCNIGEIVKNTTDTTQTTVTAIDSDTQLTLAADIFISGEAYLLGDHPSTCYYNKATNLFIEQVKEGVVLTSVVNANIFNNIIIRLVGQTGFGIFSPYATTGSGNRYGYDWDTAYRNSPSAENLMTNVFVTDSLRGYDAAIKAAYVATSFGDGNTYHAEGACIRMQGPTERQTAIGFAAEPGDGTGYQIDASSNDAYIQGNFNVTAGTNGDPTSNTILNGAGGSIASMAIRALQTYSTKVMDVGSDAAPTIHDRFDATTGIRFPTAGEMALIGGGSQRVVVGDATYPTQIIGSMSIDGDTRPKATYPIADNAYTLGTVGARWQNMFATQVRVGAGAVIWTSGAGTPESSVTAPVGSLYTNTSGSTGTTFYVKETGAGNTGWVAK
tara:strand:+ start:24059 stop:26266 length:2208 start_codon:yes stop_codon:yes gene_type:complete